MEALRSRTDAARLLHLDHRPAPARGHPPQTDLCAAAGRAAALTQPVACRLFNEKVSRWSLTPPFTSACARIVPLRTPFRRSAGHWATVWFGKDPAFDARFCDAFVVQHGAAARGELMPWLATPEGALSL